MKRVDDFRLKFGKQELVPIMVGGMGVDISTAELALETARLGGIGHISDAMVTDVSDRRFDTSFVKDKTKFYKYNIDNADKSGVKFDLGHVAEATRLHVGRTMEAKRGDGMVFVNCMEKLTMNAPRKPVSAEKPGVGRCASGSLGRGWASWTCLAFLGNRGECKLSSDLRPSQNTMSSIAFCA